MQIAASSMHSDYARLVVQGSKRQAIANTPLETANLADKVTISTQARAMASHATTALYDTDQGAKPLDIDAYFTPGSKATYSPPDTLPPLLLPSPNNIRMLSRHITAAMPQFLKENNIPSPPSSITYDTQGQIQLPVDYQYAAAFKQALDQHPAMDRQLRTVNALSSHLAEMRKAAPFQAEYAAAPSASEQAAVVQKYSWLFSQNRQFSQMALVFDANGTLSVTADGQLLPV